MAGFSLPRLFRTFGRNRAGAIAPIFALVAVPMILAAGVGIDVSRVVSSRNNLQDALDAAALAVGRMPQTTPLATLQAQAEYWVKANLADKNIGAVTVKVTTGTGTIDVSGASSIPPAVVGIMGVQSLPVAGHSAVTWGTSHIELALVLDNTGSMADDNKLDSLVDAATSLVNTLSSSASQSNDTNALKIGVVPFSMTVNIGSTYQGQNWLAGVQPSAYGEDVADGANRFSLFSKMSTTWKGCVEDRPMPYDVQDTTPTSGATLFVPFFAPDEPDDNSIPATTYTYRGTTYVTSYYNFLNDYIADKTGGTDWKDREVDSSKYTKKPNVGVNTYWGDAIGPNSGCNTTSLLRMTTDMAAVKSKLNQMVAVGDTEIPIGLVWGWHLLSPNAPFGDGAAYGANGTTKIAVLVTDGQNTYGSTSNPNGSYYTAMGYGWQKRISSTGTAAGTASALNDRLKLLCSNMKAAGVVVYTVPLEVTDTTIKSLLQGCASSSDKYLDVSSSSGLSAAFGNIAGSISALRLSK